MMKTKKTKMRRKMMRWWRKKKGNSMISLKNKGCLLAKIYLLMNSYPAEKKACSR
jgi:hypothetical protein